MGQSSNYNNGPLLEQILKVTVILKYRGDQPFFSVVLIVLYNSSLERSHPKASKTGFIFVVGPILKILHHF